MDSAGARELTFILLSMVFLFALALVAVALFFRQWHREKAEKPLRRTDKTGPPAQNPAGQAETEK